MRTKKVTVYGWPEHISEVAFGVNAEIVETDAPLNFDDETGELDCAQHPTPRNGEYDRGGRWFKTYRQAVRAAVVELETGIVWRRQAIKEIKSQRKPTPTADGRR
jgi:hypothetical protein